MFRVFGRNNGDQSERELHKEAVREFKKIRKYIKKNGGAEKICYDYWTAFRDDEFHKEVGLVLEDSVPYEKFAVTISALDLLDSWKKEGDNDPAIKEVMRLLSLRVYVASLTSINSEELDELHQSLVDVVGDTDDEKDKIERMDLELKEIVRERKSEAEKAWTRWKDAETFDILEAIRGS